MASWLIVGLGNPGRQYEKTRHNMGFRVADCLVARAGGQFRRSWRTKAQISKCVLKGERLQVVKPLTYMNRSGTAVAVLRRKSGIPLDHLVLIYDDVSLPLGRIRVRAQGGPGGHNGMRSVVAMLGGQAFPRVRVGIGSPPDGGDGMVRFVLSAFRQDEWDAAEIAVQRAADAVERLITIGVEEAMNEFNG